MFGLLFVRMLDAAVPTVAAVRGLALGGGCEFAMHCDRVVAALESYLGLVEVGVGLLPAGGGCKELALRAAGEAKGGDLLHFVRRHFQTVAMATVAKSALDAKALGFLRGADTVALHPFELLHVAKADHLDVVGALTRLRHSRSGSPPVRRSSPLVSPDAQRSTRRCVFACSAETFRSGWRRTTRRCG